MPSILIIDDDPKICQVLTRLVDFMGHHTSVAHTIKDGLTLAQKDEYDLILLDLNLPDGNSLEVIPDLLGTPSKPEIIIITGTGDLRGAEIAFKYGAWDYIPKPFVLDEVSLPITRALQYHKEKHSNTTPISLNRSGIIGESSGILHCLDEVAKASFSDASVLITGETGTGKELFAKAIHNNSKRSLGPFIIVDCGTIPETLVESTLFGHERGAFTGADKKQEGVILQADGGTLFLDEIGDLPYNLQKSLLRVLQDKRIRPLGHKQDMSIDFRLVAATNRDLDRMVEENTFRQDLLYRIRALDIKIPPLRERENDIEEIAIHKTRQIAKNYNLGTLGLSSEFLDILRSYEWPGNVRELINVVEHALASVGDDHTLLPKHLPPKYRTIPLSKTGILSNKMQTDSTNASNNQQFMTLADYRNEAEKKYLVLLLKRSDGNRQKACSLSGLSQSQLYNLLKKHGLPRFSS